MKPDLCRTFTSRVCDGVMKNLIATFSLEDSGLIMCHKIDSSNP